MAHELLNEAHSGNLDDGARHRLTLLSDHAWAELEEMLPAPLARELADLSTPLGDRTGTDGELRIALAELVGWIDGAVASTASMIAEIPPVSSP